MNIEVPAGPLRLLDPGFDYVPAAATDVTATWRRFGFNPRANAERRARLKKQVLDAIKAAEGREPAAASALVLVKGSAGALQP